MKIATCLALSTVIGADYYANKGDKFVIRLSEAVRLGDRIKILSTRDDEDIPAPRPPSSGTLGVEAPQNNRMQKKAATRNV